MSICMENCSKLYVETMVMIKIVFVFNSGGDANFVLSTSLSGFTVLHGGMAPMVENGYGVFYNINTDT